MTQPMSKEAMLAALHDVRLPIAAEGEALSDALVVLGLAGLALLLLVGAVRLVSTRRSGPKPQSLKQQIDTLSALPEPQRRVALLHLLKARSAARFEALRARLYCPDVAPTTDEIIAELSRD